MAEKKNDNIIQEGWQAFDIMTPEDVKKLSKTELESIVLILANYDYNNELSKDLINANMSDATIKGIFEVVELLN